MSPHQEVHEVVDAYLASLFDGDVERLRSTFHPGAILSGEVKGSPYYRPLDEYLEVVRNRKSPKALGETFRMQVLSVEVTGPIAFVKTHSPMLGFNYFDFLSLVRHGGRWVIAAKIFTHV
jgi:hypothetical protein